MTNRAARLRERIEQREQLRGRAAPVVTQRTQNSITQRLEDGRNVTQVSIGPIHYERDGEYREINTDWRDRHGEFADAVDRAPYHAEVRPDGTRRVWPRAEVADEWVEFHPIQEWNTRRGWRDISLIRRGRGGSTLTFEAPRLEFKLTAQPTRLKADLVLSSVTEAVPYRFPHTLHGFTLSGGQLHSIAEGRAIGHLPPVVVYDADGEPHEVEHTVTEDAVEVTGDMSGLSFPVTIDPTVDSFPVSAGADDGRVRPGTTFIDTTSAQILFPHGQYAPSVEEGFWYFRNISITPGSTILGAFITHYSHLSGSTASNQIRIVMHAEGNPEPPETVSEYEDAPRTSNSVTWEAAQVAANVEYDTDDFSTVIQEIIGRPDWSSGNTVGVFHEYIENVSANVRCIAGSFESGFPSVLHVEWEEPTAPDPPLNPVATNITATSATVSADPVQDAESYVLRWRVKGS